MAQAESRPVGRAGSMPFGSRIVSSTSDTTTGHRDHADDLIATARRTG
ncbi:hypothetical protein [Amycolatopsis sp. NPDC051061]